MYSWIHPDGSERTTQWAFVDAGSTEATRLAHEQLSQRIGMIIVASAKHGVLQNLGNGFVVGHATRQNGQRLILLLTAAHILREALHQVRPEAIEILARPISPSPVRLLGSVIRQRSLAIAFLARGGRRSFPVVWCSLDEPSDLALIGVDARDNSDQTPRCGINSDRLVVGSRLMVAGYIMQENEQPRRVSQSAIERNVTVRLEMRMGLVTEAMAKQRHIDAFTYASNIPICPGMSGSPVFATDNSNYTPFNAVGICARDFSTVFNDASIPGESYIVAIEAIYSLFVPASFSPDFQPQQQALMRSFGSLIDDAGAQKESIVLAKRKDRIFACRSFDYPGLLIHSTEPPAS